jgi:hypothetical protein
MANAPGTHKNKNEDRPSVSTYSGAASEAWQQTKDEAANLGEKAKDLASQATEKAKEIASSAADKARDVATSASRTASNVASTVGEKAESATASVGSGMESLAGTIRENAPQGGMLGSASSTVADSLEKGGRYLQEEGLSGIGQDLTRWVKNNPMPAFLVGIGIGYLIAHATRR